MVLPQPRVPTKLSMLCHFGVSFLYTRSMSATSCLTLSRCSLDVKVWGNGRTVYQTASGRSSQTSRASSQCPNMIRHTVSILLLASRQNRKSKRLTVNWKPLPFHTPSEVSSSLKFLRVRLNSRVARIIFLLAPTKIEAPSSSAGREVLSYG